MTFSLNPEFKRALKWTLIVINVIWAIQPLFSSIHVDSMVLLLTSTRQLPYGFLWFWINPVGWGETLYKLYALAFQAVTMLPMIWLVKKGKMNYNLPWLYLFTTAYYRYFWVVQEITIMASLPYVAVSPLFLLPFALQRFPFSTVAATVTLNRSDPAYQCFSTSVCGPVTVKFFNIFQEDFYAHITFAWWILVPLVIWYMRRRGKPWDEKRFVKWAGVFLFATCVMGFLIAVTYGYHFAACALPAYTNPDLRAGCP